MNNTEYILFSLHFANTDSFLRGHNIWGAEVFDLAKKTIFNQLLFIYLLKMAQ